jgi:hypothetical protein
MREFVLNPTLDKKGAYAKQLADQLTNLFKKAA